MRKPGPFVPFVHDQETTPEDLRRQQGNQRAVNESVVRHAAAGLRLTRHDVARWHKALLQGLSYVPDACYLGAYRGSSHAWLIRYDVAFGGGRHRGTPASDVSTQIDVFFKVLNDRVRALTAEIPLTSSKSVEAVRRVADLAAWVHGEWIRIHPFANGNGRSARTLANWILVRFRLLPVVGYRPRPGPPYAQASEASIAGDHTPLSRLIVELLAKAPPLG